MQPTLSTASIVITVLAFLVGLLNVAVQTGKILNQWPVPAKLGPYLVVLGSFFGGAYANLQSQSPLVISAPTIFFAFFAGLSTLLVGATPGLASHLFGAAVNVKRPAPAPAEVAAIDNATKPPGSPGGVGGVAATMLLCIALPAMGLLGIAAATEGCTTQQAQAVTPPVLDLAKCVAEGALAGDSLGELVAKCGGDVPAIITALFSSKEPAVKLSKAHAEARRAVAVDAGAQ